VLTNPPDRPDDFQSEEEEGAWNKAMAERGEAIAWHTDAVNKGGRGISRLGIASVGLTYRFGCIEVLS
jgi:hypothetical protein